MASGEERAEFDDRFEHDEGGGPRFTSGPLDERRRDLGLAPDDGPRTLAPEAGSDDAPAAARSAEPASPLRAGFGVRLVAMLIDLIALALAEVALAWVVWSALLAAESILGHPLRDAPDLFAAFLGSGSLALVAGYFIVLHAGPGQTLGKAALSVRVARPDGRPIGLVRSAVRFVGYFLSAVPLGIGFLLALASGRRALHDVVAGTAVVRV